MQMRLGSRIVANDYPQDLVRKTMGVHHSNCDIVNTQEKKLLYLPYVNGLVKELNGYAALFPLISSLYSSRLTQSVTLLYT